MTRSTSAFATVTLVIILAIAAVAGYGVVQFKDVFAPSRPVKQTTVLDTSAQQALVAAQANQVALQKDIVAHQAALDALKAKDQQAAGFNAGVGIALSGEANPSIGVKVAQTLQGETAKSLDPATTAQLQQFQTVVAQLRASNDTISTALVVAQQARDKAISDAKIAINQAAISDDQAKLAAAQTVTLTKQTATQADALKKWASDNEGLLTRIKHLTLGLIAVGALIVLIGWGLPLVGKAFPAFAPAAKIISAPFLLILHLLHEGEKKALTAAHDATKLVLAKTQAALTNEQAAHAATQATLLKVATTP